MKKIIVSNIRNLIGRPYSSLAQHSEIKYQQRFAFQNTWEIALGRADVALIPSNEYAMIGSFSGFKYGITYRNRSGRLILYANQTINTLHTIYYYADSGSSAPLLKLLLSELWMSDPRVLRTRRQISLSELLPGEGLLVLHDEDVDIDQVPCLVKEDLVSVWRKWTGLPFVFHIWALSGHFKNFALVDKLLEKFNAIADYSSQQTNPGNFELALSEDDIAGLNCFYELCHSRNLLPAAEYKVIEPGSGKRNKSHTQKQIYDTLLAGKRISMADGIKLATTCDLTELGMLAELLKQGLYSGSQYEELTVVDLAVPDYETKLKKITTPALLLKNLDPGNYDLEYYKKLISNLKKQSSVLVEGFGVGDILELSDKTGKSMHAVVEELSNAGLDIFSGDYFTIKFDGYGSFLQTFEEWLRLMRWSHRYATGSSCSIPYLMEDNWEEWFLYLTQVRKLQDLTQGFRYFYIDLLSDAAIDAERYLLQVSLARIFLDNISSQATFTYVKDSWLNSLALEFGCNRLVNLRV